MLYKGDWEKPWVLHVKSDGNIVHKDVNILPLGYLAILMVFWSHHYWTRPHICFPKAYVWLFENDKNHSWSTLLQNETFISSVITPSHHVMTRDI